VVGFIDTILILKENENEYDLEEGSDLLHFCEHFFKGYFKVYYYGQRAELPLGIKERGREIHSNIGDPIELYSCMIYDYFKFSRIFISTKSIIKSWIH
jgi:hypothetical protein